jgi:hypothetical protein
MLTAFPFPRTVALDGFGYRLPATRSISLSASRARSPWCRQEIFGIQAQKIYQKPYIPMLEENNVRQGFSSTVNLSPSENALPEYLQALLTFAYYTDGGSKKSYHSN